MVQSRRAWLKTSSLLSEARKTHSNIKCVGSVNEQGPLRLFLNAHLSHEEEQIFLFEGDIRSISDRTFKIYRRREKYKEPGKFLQFFSPPFVSWVMCCLHLRKRIDLQRLFIDSLLLTFHKLFPCSTLWSFSIAYRGRRRRWRRKHETGRVGFPVAV